MCCPGRCEHLAANTTAEPLALEVDPTTGQLRAHQGALELAAHVEAVCLQHGIPCVGLADATARFGSASVILFACASVATASDAAATRRACRDADVARASWWQHPMLTVEDHWPRAGLRAEARKREKDRPESLKASPSSTRMQAMTEAAQRQGE